MSGLGSTPLALGLAAFATLAAAAPRARAQDADTERLRNADAAARGDVSPQHAALELRFGPYSPKVDESLPTPVYADFFGDADRYMFGVEVDWQAWRAPYVGTLGVGVGWGYTQMSGANKVPQNTTPEQAPPDIAQESTLNIMPLSALGVLRVDTFARNLGVPLVPYAKLGMAWAFWWVDDGIGTAANDAGTKGRDVSVGYQAALGGMFLLDIIDPAGALAAEAESGVNNSYIFFEWSMSNYGGNQMNVGSNNWVTGLAFEL